jgi:small subunit ribosomal protein S7
MSRRRRAEKRSILPDPVYQSEVLAQFINLIMKSGKKSVAEATVYKVLENLKENDNDSPIAKFEEILDKVGPLVEVKSRRVGGATYQVPIEVRPVRKFRIAMSWVIKSARKRHEKGFIARLTAEFKDVIAGRGASLKIREDMHKMAEANKAFAHYRW